MIVTDWTPYSPEFTEREFACSHTGKCLMEQSYMDALLKMRRDLSFPFVITSGYRHPTHPIEAQKKSETEGEHTLGNCADIQVYGLRALWIVRYAPRYGFMRVGVKQHGPTAKRFVHLGMGGEGLPSPWIWSYAA